MTLPSDPPSAPRAAPSAVRDAHARKVARVAAALRAWPSGRPLSLRKRAASHQVPKHGDRKYQDDKLDVTDLDAILELDVEGRTCTAEPGVTFVDLVRATLPHGLVPFVVPELKTITIGGAVSGCSLESMSFRCGGFHDACVELEVVTSGGDVLRCTPENDQQHLFHMVHGAFGTLGVVTQLKFRLTPAQPFVRVSYETHRTQAAYAAAILSRSAQPDVDFLDGIIHGPDRWVLCVGRFASQAPYTSRYDWVTPYYETTATRAEDWFTTPDYFFRYDRGVTAVRPRSFLGRLLFGPFLASSQYLRLAEKLAWALPRERPAVTVDLFLPFAKFAPFMEWYWRELGPHPLWCVPYRTPRPYPWISDARRAKLGDELFVDLAIYGYKQRDGRNEYRLLEEQLEVQGGVKTLISHNFYSEAEFWTIFHRENHFAAKRTADPRGLFRDLYEKTCRSSQGR